MTAELGPPIAPRRPRFGCLALLLAAGGVLGGLVLMFREEPGPSVGPVQARYVMGRLRYGRPYSDPTGAEGELWTTYLGSGMDLPEVWGSTARYRLLGWMTKQEGHHVQFQSLDLIRGGRSEVPVAWDNGIQGWLAPATLVGEPPQFREPYREGPVRVNLEGTWRTVSKRGMTGLLSAGGPFKMYTNKWRTFSGDMVVVVGGEELVRQHVEHFVDRNFYDKVQALIDHDVMVFMAGAPGAGGEALVLDLTRGHPRPPQKEGGIFPSRDNTLPRVVNFGCSVPGTRTQLNPWEVRPGVAYLLTVEAFDPDLEVGDSICGFEWDLGDGRIRKTDRPELTYAFPRRARYDIKVRALDRSGTPGPWGGFYWNLLESPVPVTDLRLSEDGTLRPEPGP
jgi:hypothetical protein